MWLETVKGTFLMYLSLYWAGNNIGRKGSMELSKANWKYL